MGNFNGVLTALVTPFANGAIDYESLENLLSEQMKAGVDGLVVLGTTGESPTVEAHERRPLWQFIKERVAGHLPLILGTGTNSTQTTIQLTREAEDWGADGALVVTPYYNKPPQRGLYQHFASVAKSVRLPILLYNVPSRTITSLDVETVAALAKIPNICGIKEATGNIEVARRLREQCGADFLITSGDDGTFLELASVGGGGVISVLSNLAPAEMKRMWLMVKDEGQEAGQVFARYAELNAYLYCEANPIPIKRALYEKGILASPELRLPLVELEEGKVDKLRSLMKSVELL